jgi:hypothetical protein
VKVIIAGSRGIDDYPTVLRAIVAADFDITEVVSGGARGVDRLGEKYAALQGLPVKRFIPDWANDGKRAGFDRNREMAHYADALIAVWDGQSRGTRHMIEVATRGGMPVSVYRTDKA